VPRPVTSDSPETGPFPPPDLTWLNRQLKFRPAPEQGLERAFSFDARELGAEAEMDDCPKGDVSVRVSPKIELFRSLVRPRIHVGRGHLGRTKVSLSRGMSTW
jgi:hypothetical protein